jgi:hypothetical protein
MIEHGDGSIVHTTAPFTPNSQPDLAKTIKKRPSVSTTTQSKLPLPYSHSIKQQLKYLLKNRSQTAK